MGNPVKASRIGKSVGYEAMLCRMEKSGKAIKDGKLKERTRKIVAAAMQTARNRQKFEQELKRQGIDVVFRQNDSGRIYGVTFIDHDSRVVARSFRRTCSMTCIRMSKRDRPKALLRSGDKGRTSRSSRIRRHGFRSADWAGCSVDLP